MPTLIKPSVDVIFSRITCTPFCCGEPCESIGCRERISYRTRVIHTFDYHIIIRYSLIIIRTPQIIVLIIYHSIGIEFIRVPDVLLNVISIQSRRAVFELILVLHREASLIFTNTCSNAITRQHRVLTAPLIESAVSVSL